MEAVIRTGGKQYRVREGSVLDVASIAVEPGSSLELREVLLLKDGESITVGQPLVADAVVLAEVVSHGKGRKVINFKYKAKTRYRRKRGHRQGFTRLAVRSIAIGGAAAQSPAEAAAPATPGGGEPAPTPARRRRRTAGSEVGAEEVAVAGETTAQE